MNNDLTKNNSLFNLITNQKINYLCLGFLQVQHDGSLTWNLTSCSSDYKNKELNDQFKILHSNGVCISASIGGQDSAKQYLYLDPQKALESFEKIRQTQPYLDGIDFDIESKNSSDYPKLGNKINGVAKLFKENGYVVTAAPTSSQISPGCGGNSSGWGTSNQALINLNMDYIDGIMIQWYEGGCINGNGGQCPLTAQGIVNYYIALSGNKSLSGYSGTEGEGANNPPIIGACTPSTKQIALKWASCSESTCYTFPTEKIAIGFQTYAPICDTNKQWDSGENTLQTLTTAIALLQQKQNTLFRCGIMGNL